MGRFHRFPTFDQTDEKMKLFGLVFHIIQTKFPMLSDSDFDEACSIGFLKIVEVLHSNKYDNKKSKLSTFICVCVYRAIRWELVEKKYPHLFDDAKLDKFTKEEQTEHIKYKHWQEIKSVLRDKLTPQQKRVFELRLQGYKQSEIANVLKTSKANINCMIRKIEAKGKTIYESSCS